MTPEHVVIGCVLLDNSLVDAAMVSGLTPKHFTTAVLADLWFHSVSLRAAGKPVDFTGLHLAGCDMETIMICEKSVVTSLYFQESLDKVLDAHTSKAVGGLARQLFTSTKQGRDAMLRSAEDIMAALERKEVVDRSVEKIGSEVEEVALARISGQTDPRIKIEWPLARANAMFTEMMPHELVCIGARPKQGKSSIALQIMGHNVSRGLRLAYFTLETADTSAFSLMAAQIARVDLQKLAHEPRDKQQAYLKAIRDLKQASNFHIFERDMSMTAIESRCRLLKASFEPQCVIIDHLHQIQNDVGGSAYEKLTDIALRMVELRKKMGCAIILCLQLNRGSEVNERPPRASDSRDSSAIEAAAHRLVLLYRPKEDFNGQAQIGPDVGQRNIYDYFLMQELMRDGPSASIRAKFNAPHSVFTEN